MPPQNAAGPRAVGPMVGALRNSPRPPPRAACRAALQLGYGDKTSGTAAGGARLEWSGNCTCECAYTAVLFAAGKKGLKET